MKTVLVISMILWSVSFQSQSLRNPVPEIIKREGFMFLKEPPPKISCDLTKQCLKSCSDLYTFTPLKRFKVTIKSGLNGKNVAKEIKDSFGDVESYNIIGLVNYDARAKFYINDKWRIVMRASQMAIPGSKSSKFETIGVSFKI